MLRACLGTFTACSSLKEISLKVKIYNMYIFTKCDKNVIMYHVIECRYKVATMVCSHTPCNKLLIKKKVLNVINLGSRVRVEQPCIR